jgi:hypothetical protein
VLQRAAQHALRAVAQQLTPDSGVAPSALRARFSPIGEGLFVYPADVLQRGRPPVVWLIKAGRPYALDDRVRAMTPRLPDKAAIPKGVLTSAEQSGELEAMVWRALNNGPWIGSEYQPEAP